MSLVSLCLYLVYMLYVLLVLKVFSYFLWPKTDTPAFDNSVTFRDIYYIPRIIQNIDLFSLISSSETFGNILRLSSRVSRILGVSFSIFGLYITNI